MKKFLQIEAAGGIVLMIATLVALIYANSPYGTAYRQLVDPLHLAVNDGLMAIFFLLVGMEIKREMLEGALSTKSQAVLPLVAALGGVAMPAIIYSALNWNTPEMRGWAVPCATDIAFSLGVLALLGKRVPSSLKVFLMALAVIDDLAAVLIIALFYSGSLAWGPLALAGVCLAVLWKCAREGVASPLPYLMIGLVLWSAVFFSGVHATVAGVLLGLIMPLAASRRLIHPLHGWVAFGIVPLFAFVNAGVSLGEIFEGGAWLSPMPLGIILGLFVGKPLGIFGACALMIWLKRATLPQGATMHQLLGVSMIAGIGFTMSLFIGLLAFSLPAQLQQMQAGVLLGSLLSAIVGMLWLSAASSPARTGVKDAAS